VNGRGGQTVASPANGGNLCGGGAGAGAQGAGRGGRGGGGGRGGAGNASEPTTTTPRGVAPAGLCSATFPGGYTLSVMTVDLADVNEAREVWHNKPNDRVINNLNNIQWTGTHLVFPYTPQGDEFERWFAIDLSNPTSDAFSITTTNGLIEDATMAAVSKDKKTLYYSTNAEDIERRHIWAVPTAGGQPPRRVSSDSGISTYPQPLASGKYVATLFFDYNVPASVGIVPASGGPTKVIWPNLANTAFPTAEHVRPEVVWTTAADGQKISNTLFIPKDLKPGEKRPAIVFVHGGPVRQMLPGYHYMQFYHWAYGFNQYLQEKGYIVLSINYRGGIGYGRSFRQAPGTNSRGNSEYQDVLAGAKYLMSRADVDTSRMGIWGLSYGGLLTSQALARNSDIFKAGADYAGVHLYTPTLDTSNVAYKSSAISAIETWKSPVLLVHGDDDRNVDFAQTVGLVNLLRAHGVYYELIVVPDDLHESMMHSVWMDTWDRTAKFLDRFVRDRQTAPSPMGK
jgi:dipeptidyl aminopeptidase/acylaminoacyl peptidase